MRGASERPPGVNVKGDESFFNAATAAGAAPPLNPAWNQESWAATFLDNARQFGVQLVCAGGSGAIAKTAVAPLERAKILAQVQSMGPAAPGAPRYTGPWDALWRMRRAEGGWRVWFRGNGANVIRLVPEVGFKFAAHDQFRVMFSPPDGSPLGVQEKMAAGAATGVCKTLLFYPLDFCRTRITAHTTFAPPTAVAALQGGARVAPTSAAASAAASSAAAAARRQIWTRAAAGRAIGTSSSSTLVSSTSSISSSSITSSRSSAGSSSSSSGGRAASRVYHHPTRLVHGAAAAAGPPPLTSAAAAAAAAAPRHAAAPGVISTLRSALANEGLLSVYKGMLLSLPGVVVYTSVSFTAYDTFKHLLPADKNSKETWWYPFAKMGCGAAAGVSAQTCSYPLDTLRRRMQMAGATAGSGSIARSSSGGSSSSGSSGRPARVSYASLLRTMSAAEGGLLTALFRGWSVNCVKIVPGAAVQFVAYDALRVGVTWLDPTSGAQSPL